MILTQTNPSTDNLSKIKMGKHLFEAKEVTSNICFCLQTEIGEHTEHNMGDTPIALILAAFFQGCTVQNFIRNTK